MPEHHVDDAHGRCAAILAGAGTRAGNDEAAREYKRAWLRRMKCHGLVVTPHDELAWRLNMDTATLYGLVEGFYERLGHTEAALPFAEEWVQHARSIYQKQPGGEDAQEDLATALNALAWGVLQKPDTKPLEVKRARRMAEESLALFRKLGWEESSPVVLDTLALACYRSGQVDRAVSLQERAVTTFQKVAFVEKELKEMRQRLAKYRAAQASPTTQPAPATRKAG